ncbi:MAG: hypothetical protein P1S60_04510 [Anaerolineae bacterium]|nr:hypothetical protein [Anaerolineae bacterium]
MINRAREIAQMMGYNSIDVTLDAIGRGELILLKVDTEQRLKMARWIMERVPSVREEDEDLAECLDDLADGITFALELMRYPADTDICEMDLPLGWPSYCDKDLRK